MSFLPLLATIRKHHYCVYRCQRFIARWICRSRFRHGLTLSPLPILCTPRNCFPQFLHKATMGRCIPAPLGLLVADTRYQPSNHAEVHATAFASKRFSENRSKLQRCADFTVQIRRPVRFWFPVSQYGPTCTGNTGNPGVDGICGNVYSLTYEASMCCLHRSPLAAPMCILSKALGSRTFELP